MSTTTEQQKARDDIRAAMQNVIEQGLLFDIQDSDLCMMHYYRQHTGVDVRCICETMNMLETAADDIFHVYRNCHTGDPDMRHNAAYHLARLNAYFNNNP